MSHVPIDPSRSAVLFADLQVGILERATTIERAQLRRAVAALAELARLFNLPVICTTASDGAQGPLLTPEIEAALGSQPLNTRTTTDAFTHPQTREAILRTGRSTLLISGVATEVIVQHSALSARSHGMNVQVVVDACGGLSERTEDAALRRFGQSGVVTTCVASVAGQLAGDFSQPLGREAIGVLYKMA